MRVRLSAEAERDLEAIGDWIARDDLPRALSFVAELREACLGLARFPNRFPLVSRHERQGVRRRVHRDYLIFYSVAKAEVTVLHVLHGATDYASLLFPGADVDD